MIGKGCLSLEGWGWKCYGVLGGVWGSYGSVIGRLAACYAAVRRERQRRKVVMCWVELDVLGRGGGLMVREDESVDK